MPDLLLPELSTRGLVFLLVSAFIAAMARGFSGFGAALIFLPLAATVVDPKIASPLLLITDAVLAVGFIPDAFRRADKREVSIMGAGAAIGIPLGTLLLVHLDALTIRWAIVVLATAMLTLLFPAGAIAARRRRRFRLASAPSRACAAAPRKPAGRP